MSRYHLLITLSIGILFSSSNIAIASELYATESATVRATVPSNAGPAAGDTTAPSVPILLRPVDGTYTNDARPEFVWLKSTDNSNSVSYDLYLNGVATYLGINNYGNSLTGQYVARLEDGSLRLLGNNPLSDGSYDWRVVAYDLSGNQQGSASWHFTIDTIAPPLSYLSPTEYITGLATTKLKLSSEPRATISILILQNGNTIYTNSLSTGDLSDITFSAPLVSGDYLLFAESVDLAGNKTSLGPITLTSRTLTVPGTSIIIPPTTIRDIGSQVVDLTTLPATAMLIATRLRPAVPYIYLIAVAIMILLATRRKHNIRVLEKGSRKPIYDVAITDQDNHVARTNKRGYAYQKSLANHSFLLLQLPSASLPISLCIVQKADKITIIEL